MRVGQVALWSGAVLVFMGANDDNGCSAERAANAVPAECQSASDCQGDPGIDCVGAWACNVGQCEFECGERPVETGCYGDEDCSDGKVCNAAEVCHNPPGCNGEEPCDAVCYGECVDAPVDPNPNPNACMHSGQCADGEYCTVETGACDSNCAEGMTCPAVCWGECKPRENGAICYGDDGCRADERCDMDPCVFPDASGAAEDRIACGGVCVPRAGCGDHSDCAEGEVCACAPHPYDAPANGLIMCNLECQPAEPVCAADSDCAPGYLCQNGVCVEPQRECFDDSVCPENWSCQSSCGATDPSFAPDEAGDRYCPSYCAPVGGTCADTGVTCREGETCVNECWTACPDCACAPGEECDCPPCQEECNAMCVPDHGTCNDELCPAGTYCGCADPNAATPDSGIMCDLKCIPYERSCWADSECYAGEVCVASDCGAPEPLPCDPSFESCDAERPAPQCPGTCQVREEPAYDCKTDENCISADGQQGFCAHQVCEAYPAIPCAPDDANCGAMPPPPEEMVCYGYCQYDRPVQCDPNADTCPDGTHCENVGGCAGSDGGADFMPCMLDYQCVPDRVECASDCDCDPSLACNEGVCQRMGRMNTCGLADCTADDQCAEGEYCAIDYTQPVCDCFGCPCSIPHGTCQPRPDDGSCDSDADCYADEQCTLYYPPCAPPPDEFAPPPVCEPIGVCEPRVEPSECVRGGCSGEICTDQALDIDSICLWLPEYECLAYAGCGRGADGECGWQKTERYIQCMEDLPQPE